MSGILIFLVWILLTLFVWRAVARGKATKGKSGFVRHVIAGVVAVPVGLAALGYLLSEQANDVGSHEQASAVADKQVGMAPPAGLLTPDMLDEPWPFTVDRVVLHCVQRGVYAAFESKLYALNNPPIERMRALGAHPPNAITIDPDDLMARWPVIQRGLELCP